MIVGAGGHGLSTAYYLAKNHGITNVAVLERGWLGGGNMGRNTTVVRSNYLWDESAAIYEFSLKLWESLEDELDFDVMLSQRGVVNLAHSLHDVREVKRRVSANNANGIDAEWLEPDDLKAFLPIINISPDVRYPVLGASLQRRGGIARHDHVAWGYARGADRLGVDIIQNCEVTGFLHRRRTRSSASRRLRGPIRAGTVALAAAGHTSTLADRLGIRLPIQSHPLQALVSELIEPFLNTRDHVERRARVREPARQGRARDGRGHRCLQLVRAARLVQHHRAPARRGDRAVPGIRRRFACCAPGRASSTSARTRRRSSGACRWTTST